MCFHEILSIARLWPSARVHSTLGDMVVRNPSTWHRGTPNRQAQSRHMLTFLFKRKGKTAAVTADGRVIKKQSRQYG